MDPIVLGCLAIAFAIGSNDTSNSFGICIGCGILTIKRATYLLFFLVLLGIMLGGGRVMHTVGGEIAELNWIIVGVALFLSSIAIISANIIRTPVSSHHAVIASLIGSAIALGRSVNYLTISKIVLSWIVSPFGAMIIAAVTYLTLERLVFRLPMLKIEKLLRFLLLISGSLIAFNTGANELATALAPAVYYGAIDAINASFIGSVMLFIGARTISTRVVETVGKGITTLDPFSGFAAQFSAGLTVLIFTLIGMPISTTYCVVGAISGVGTYKGLRGVKMALIRRIALSWVMTPLAALISSYLVTTLLI